MEAFIIDAVRTAGGRKGGALRNWHPADLAGEVLKALVARTGIDPEMIDDVVMGCVAQVGEQATNIGRSAILAAGLPERIPGTTVDRQCGSSQQAIHFAAQAVMSGTMNVVVAAGVESMTRVPAALTSLAEQHGFGTYISPAVQDRYSGYIFNQFEGAERMAAKYGLNKDLLDEFAFASHSKAAEATRRGDFEQQIVPIPIGKAGDDSELHRIDEGIRLDAKLDAIRQVKRLREDGLLTAATSSQLCDGASAVMIVNRAGLALLGAEPLARIHNLTVLGGDPVIMLEAPIPATRLALERAGMAISDIDLYEVNEAFAPIPLAWAKEIDADPARLNISGGAISLGHPLGASGTRLMTTLVHNLRRTRKRFGLQTMCEGGGLANVTIVERL